MQIQYPNLLNIISSIIMKENIVIAILFSMVLVICILVWVILYFAREHIKKRSAVSKAFYRRARQGIPNSTDVELGPPGTPRCTVQLAPYRYGKRGNEMVYVRPTKAQRAQRARRHFARDDFHVIPRGPKSHKSSVILSFKQTRRSDHGSVEHHQSMKQSKKSKKQKRKQKAQAKSERKKNKNQNQSQNQNNSQGQNDGHSNHGGWGGFQQHNDGNNSDRPWGQQNSNRNSHAGSKQHSQSHHSAQNGEQSNWQNNSAKGSFQGIGNWMQQAEEENRPGSHQGSGGNMPGGWGNQDDGQKW